MAKNSPTRKRELPLGKHNSSNAAKRQGKNLLDPSTETVLSLPPLLEKRRGNKKAIGSSRNVTVEDAEALEDTYSLIKWPRCLHCKPKLCRH